jgi:hypothetical protein
VRRRVEAGGRAVLRAALALTLVAAGGCGLLHPADLNYRVDHRLHFLGPPARGLVTTPLTVRWTISGFTVHPPGGPTPPRRDQGYFAVFVDRAPIRPGESMRAVAADDLRCLHAPGCPDEAYLEARMVYTTRVPSLTVEHVPPLRGSAERVQLHTITVVLMDTDGRRIGESSWALDVRMRKVGL